MPVSPKRAPGQNFLPSLRSLAETEVEDRRLAVRCWLLLQLALSATAWAIIAGLLSLAA